MTRDLGAGHGTGWAGVAGYVARIRIAARITDRAARITAGDDTGVLDAAQADDVELLRVLDRESDQPRIRHRWDRGATSSTYNGEDDHVRPTDY